MAANVRREFAAPEFGIKAKLQGLADDGGGKFAAPEFGIKAKQAAARYPVIT